MQSESYKVNQMQFCHGVQNSYPTIHIRPEIHVWSDLQNDQQMNDTFKKNT